MGAVEGCNLLLEWVQLIDLQLLHSVWVEFHFVPQSWEPVEKLVEVIDLVNVVIALLHVIRELGVGLLEALRPFC